MFFESKEMKLARLKAEYSELCKMLHDATEIPQYFFDKRMKLKGDIVVLELKLSNK